MKKTRAWMLFAICMLSIVIYKLHTGMRVETFAIVDPGMTGQSDTEFVFDSLLDPMAADPLIRASLMFDGGIDYHPDEQQFCVAKHGPRGTCCYGGNYGKMFENNCKKCYAADAMDNSGNHKIAYNCPEDPSAYWGCTGCTYENGKLSCWCMNDMAAAEWKTRDVKYLKSVKLGNGEQVCVDKSDHNINCTATGNVSIACTLNDKFNNQIAKIKPYAVPRECRNRGQLAYNGNPQPAGDAFTCNADAESCVDRGLTYPKNSWAADIAPCPPNCDDDGTTCTRYRRLRSARVPGKKPCSDGEDDDGTSCWMRSYGRGTGSTTKKDNYEMNGLLWYPKCRDGYKSVGCCICAPKGGDRITKTAFDRYDCGDDELVGSLCYGKCPDGFHVSGSRLECVPNDGEGIIKNKFDRMSCRPHEKLVAGVCWENCIPGYKDDGAICNKLTKQTEDWTKATAKSLGIVT